LVELPPSSRAAISDYFLSLSRDADACRLVLEVEDLEGEQHRQHIGPLRALFGEETEISLSASSKPVNVIIEEGVAESWDVGRSLQKTREILETPAGHVPLGYLLGAQLLVALALGRALARS